MASLYRVLVADDHAVIRMALNLYIKKLATNVAVDEAESSFEVEKKITEKSYDLIILDLNMPGSDTVRLEDFLKSKADKTKVLIFSANTEERYAVRYLKAGADGYLDKSASADEIMNALNRMITSGRYISPSVEKLIIEQSLNINKSNSSNLADKLSSRELDVARLLSEGYTNQEIAGQLFLHPSSVSTYKNRIFQKLGVSSVIDLKEILV